MDGLAHGRGILSKVADDDASEVVAYDGMWRQGSFCGRGTTFYASGSVFYVGEWRNGNGAIVLCCRTCDAGARRWRRHWTR